MSPDPSKVPRATYRLQLHSKFGFDDAAAIAPYLADLGVSHLYASPYLQAGAGSTHGYDILDHHRVNAELGGAAGHVRMCETMGKHGLGHILDIVPNHMSIASRNNAWWWDVLENGPSSRYASYFDVDWHPPEEKLRNTVLLPILGDHYGRVIEAGEIQLERAGCTFVFRYHDHVVPVAPRSLDSLLANAAGRCESDTLAFIADAYANLPLSTMTDRASVARRHRDKQVLATEIERLCKQEPAVVAAIDEVLAEINSDPDEMDVLLERQNFRLAYWKTAGQELDYRRFFDINTLVSLRIEHEHVFQDTHELVLRWLREGVLDGVRVDHPDGLKDPEEYVTRLRQAAPQAWIVIEKILEPGERLPDAWPVEGTTGYDFLNKLAGLFVDMENEEQLTSFYADFTGEPTEYAAVVRDKKHLVLRNLFGSDVNRLTSFLAQVCERHRRYRDYTRRDLSSVLRELIACFPVYRTYVRAEAGQVREDDVKYVNEAIEAAKLNRPDLDAELFDFIGDLLLLRVRGTVESEFVMRFQQHSGPVMAKGVEDTVFYNYNRLVCLNEVGGDPGRFGMTVEDFHHDCAATQGRWGQAMLATTTHDTKRSEDVRTRMALLSEIPDRWFETCRRWAAMNERHKTASLPDRNAEYLLYQTLVGAWPIDAPRLTAYMEKASREAKAHTSWTVPNEEYDKALKTFAEALLLDADFKQSLEEFVAPLIEPGRVNSLSQTLIKLAAPGVPDLYQGTELWDLSLVDPDNRRPVDYQTRRRLLNEMQNLSLEAICQRSDEGLPKLWLVQRTLHFRRNRADLFGEHGSYEPLPVAGKKAEHVVAFTRGGQATVVAPRLPLRLKGDWEDTTIHLSDGEWNNILTSEKFAGGDLRLSELLKRFPVALLERARG